MVPFIFKPVFICVHSENADENWLEMKGTTYREERMIWICYYCGAQILCLVCRETSAISLLSFDCENGKKDCLSCCVIKKPKWYQFNGHHTFFKALCLLDSQSYTWYCWSSRCYTEWMSHRKRKERKQQPGPAGPCNILGCCLVSLRFLRDIHSIHSVLISKIRN